MIKGILLKFLKAHWISLIIIGILSFLLKYSLRYSFILSYLILLVAYFILGVLVEFIMEKLMLSRGDRYNATSGRQQRAKPMPARGDAPGGGAAVKRPNPSIPERASEKKSPTAQTRSDSYRLVLQKKNTAGYVPSGRLERIERKKNAFIELSPDDGEPSRKSAYEESVAGTDFMARTHALYRSNQARNKAVELQEEQEVLSDIPVDPVKISAPAEVPAEEFVRVNIGKEAARMPQFSAEIQENRKAAADMPAAREPVCPETVPQPPEQTVAAGFVNMIPPEPEPLRTAGDIEQISDNLSKEIGRRIEESQRTASRRRRDYSVSDLSISFVNETSDPESMPEAAASETMALTEEPIFFSDQTPDEEEPATPVRDDKVYADQNKIDALFQMSRRESEETNAIQRHRTSTVTESTARNAGFSWLKKGRVTAPETSPKSEESYKSETAPVESAVPTAVPYQIPSPQLLRGSKTGMRRESMIDASQDPRAKKLIDTLASFGVGAKIIAVIKGPAVTRYEIQPNPGVKVSRIVSLADDISLNLAATGVRIEAPIPGKEAVGIEVPNQEVEIVYLRDVIESKEYQESSSNLTFAIGKDIAGKNIVADIAKMPHLLIAGATGAGKSVCINTIIASILYKSGPDAVRMIMIDPKIVELGVYNGIPHLLVPVVTNPKKAAAALSWAVGEMERRYAEFSQFSVRDIRSYNALCSKRKSLTAMPQIVIIIDELADLMMVAAREIEDSIIRLAQKARAAGVHIIIATQRPSVDVITGLIKANIPSRIAFAVSSQVDSRTILDGAGAEKLLGRGDMLFHPIGMSKPLRVQGAFVSDGEIEALVSDIKRSSGKVIYSEEIQASMEAKMNASNQNSSGGSGSSGAGAGEEEDYDAEVIQSAAELAFEFKQLSTSFLQRKLKLGYSRASRVIDALESAGLISAADGSKPRQLLMTREEWESMQ